MVSPASAVGFLLQALSRQPSTLWPSRIPTAYLWRPSLPGRSLAAVPTVLIDPQDPFCRFDQ
jgi:hypothetical protein